jgi:hypothetical protein
MGGGAIFLFTLLALAVTALIVNEIRGPKPPGKPS